MSDEQFEQLRKMLEKIYDRLFWIALWVFLAIGSNQIVLN